jgi:apolipoprotein N-acyltransferase
MDTELKKKRWLQAGFILGVVLFLLGTLDPLEGSILILAGSILLAIVSHLFKDPQRKWYRVAATLILFGVLALWILSVLGGFGADSKLAYGWAVFILPYPAGWLMLLVLFYLRLFVQKNRA